MSLLFNMLSRLVRAFLPGSKHLLISWLQSPSAVILELKKVKSLTVSIIPHLFVMKWWDQVLWSYFFESWVLSQLFHSPFSLSSRGSLVLFHWDGVMLQFLNFFYIRGKLEKTTYLHVISKTIWYSIWYIMCLCNNSIISIILFGFPSGSMIKNPCANARGNGNPL